MISHKLEKRASKAYKQKQKKINLSYNHIDLSSTFFIGFLCLLDFKQINPLSFWYSLG